MGTTTISKLLDGVLFSVLGEACKIATSIPRTVRGAFWSIIESLGLLGWISVIVVFVVWGAAELTFRFGNSSNGCTWAFNVAVGSLTFAVFQSVVYLLLEKLFGVGIYCTLWPYGVHGLVFPAVWLFLRGIRFWDH